jgi:hypothetical protein
MANNATQQIVNRAWSFAHVLRDDGLSYMGYTEQITFLLFLKMADEQAKLPGAKTRRSRRSTAQRWSTFRASPGCWARSSRRRGPTSRTRRRSSA